MPLVRPRCVACCSALAIAPHVLGLARTAWPCMVDDAFLSLRFAGGLAHGPALTWNGGERVEGT